ncbi:MAG: molecular chaperone TorD family protein [Nitrospirae bacterium]|nr:molecular chaperone TorD family protein [Nitrospirota bacterium]
MSSEAGGSIEGSGRPDLTPSADARARENLYRFLAASFIEPPSLGSLQRLAGEVEDLCALSPQAGEHFSRELAALERDAAGCVGRLRQEFYDLFHVPTGKYTRPYEAVYRDSRVVDATRDGRPGPFEVGGLTWGPSTVAVEQFYRHAGLNLELREVPDYVGVEMEFMAFLLGEERKALEAGEAEKAGNVRHWQKAFLERHLAQWVPLLCRQILENSGSDYFKGLAHLTMGFVASESDILSPCA